VLRRGKEATAEFQKVVDHRGVVLNNVLGALGLGLGRAYVIEDDAAKAHAAYQEFLTLWKDADPDIPILIAAKAEYAKLKEPSLDRSRALLTPSKFYPWRRKTSPFRVQGGNISPVKRRLLLLDYDSIDQKYTRF
jgi:hypothetical protein